MRRLPQQHYNRSIRRERDKRALVRQFMWLACGLLLMVGFVVAARQQVVAINYGYKVEALRREQAELLAEQERLQLELEEASSPAQLERAAREVGLQETRATQVESLKKRVDQSTKASVSSVMKKTGPAAGPAKKR